MSPRLDRARHAIALAVRGMRRISGMPDYQGYLAHLRQQHPDRPVLSEREFFEEYLRARYDGGPTRCC